MKRLVDLSHDAISVRDFNGGIIEWNRGCRELYGYTREEAQGRQHCELLHTEAAGQSLSEVRAKLLEEGSWNGELITRAKDGRLVIVESELQLESFGDRQLVFASSRDITERNALEKRQRLLLGELSHRIKNTLAVVQSIAHQTHRRSNSGEQFLARFDGRIAALAAAHNLLVESNWEGADINALARGQLEPYVPEDTSRIAMNGDSFSIPADLATPFGLVLHELATNAVKYGALSRPNGRIELHWHLVSENDERRLRVTWRETGGPPAGQPRETGFGSTLIDNAIPRATVGRVFRKEGLLCTIEIKLSEDSEDTENEADAKA